MGKHSAPRGETGTMTSKTGKTATYDGKHRDGVAKGSSGQRQTTGSDVPPRGEGLK